MIDYWLKIDSQAVLPISEVLKVYVRDSKVKETTINKKNINVLTHNICGEWL